MKKKIMIFMIVCVLAYKVYDVVKRINMRRALFDAQLETIFLEEALAVAKRNQYDDDEKRRKFKR